MVTITFMMTVKAGRETEFIEVAREMERRTHAKDAGCVRYTIRRHIGKPQEFVLWEQWRDEDAVRAHLERLFGEFGRERLLGFFEKTESIRLESIA